MVAPVVPALGAYTEAPSTVPRTVASGFDALLKKGAEATPSTVGIRRTQLTGTQAAEALSRAWESRKGSPPSRATLSILTAQWALETGRGESMYNYNFAGIKGQGPSGMSFVSRTTEGFGATTQRITDRFRAYSSATEGAGDYLALLEKRFGPALEAARQGDASGFVHQLKVGGYFTGNEAAYTNSVTTMAKQALEQGFDTLGSASAGPTEAVDLGPQVSAKTTGYPGTPESLVARFSEALTRFSSGGDAPPIEPWRIAEALSRSALRIGSDEEDKNT